MDFELKTLTRARICSEKTDALVVLVPQDLTPGADPLSSAGLAGHQVGGP
jgi:leucyl aminopeptidase